MATHTLEKTDASSIKRSPSTGSSFDSGDDTKAGSPDSSSIKETAEVAPLASQSSADVKSPVTNFFARLLGLRRREQLDDLDAVATQPSVYETDQAEHYQPRADWENIAAFDTSFRWSWREEAAAVRAVDLKIMSWVLIMFLALDIDRYNLANATADNFLKDLGLTQVDYNLGNTLSKLGFLIAELPSQLISKRLGPDRWIPIQIVIFSIISGSQFWLSGRSSFLATRFLIAAFQGGFIPDTILYISYFYTKRELPIRLAFFYTINYLAVMLTGFLAVGLLQMRGILGYPGWSWMFGLEGIATLLVGIASFWMMPTAPAKTKTWFRPNGYLTDHQAKIIVNRSLRDDPAKGGMHNRQPLSLKMIRKSLGDWDLYPLYLIGLTFGIATVPVNNYLQLSFRQLGFTTVQANLLSVPNTVISVILVVVITLVSEAVDNRAFVCMAENIWLLPCFIALLTLEKIGAWQYFAIATVLLGFPYVHAIQVAWCSRNSGSVRTRTVSASLYNMAVQTSAIIGSNVYQASDAPRYFKANKALVGVILFNLIIVYPGTWLFYRHRNATKEKAWTALDSAQKSAYLEETRDLDLGCKSLDFQFAL